MRDLILILLLALTMYTYTFDLKTKRVVDDIVVFVGDMVDSSQAN